MKIELGNGNYTIGAYVEDEKIGLMIKKSDKILKVGEIDKRFGIGDEVKQEDGDVFISFDNIESLNVVQEQLSVIYLKFRGYEMSGKANC